METAKPIAPAAAALHSEKDLALAHTYHPFGFPLRLATNSPDVLESGAEAWGIWAPEFDRQPMDVRVTVQEEGELALEPQLHRQGHLFSVVSDRHNSAVLDLDRLFAYAFVSPPTAADHAWFRCHFLELIGLLLLSQRYVAAVHAACVARGGRGILLAGPGFAGKSTLAWACARAGWTYLTDDATWLVNEGDLREVLGRPHSVRFRPDAVSHFPELEGHVARVRPNGKISIEVSTRILPHIRTASRCRPAAVVFLDRHGESPSGLEPMPAVEAQDALLADTPLYNERMRQLRRTMIRRLLETPVYRMRYKTLQEGIDILGDLHASLPA